MTYGLVCRKVLTFCLVCQKVLRIAFLSPRVSPRVGRNRNPQDTPHTFPQLALLCLTGLPAWQGYTLDRATRLTGLPCQATTGKSHASERRSFFAYKRQIQETTRGAKAYEGNKRAPMLIKRNSNRNHGEQEAYIAQGRAPMHTKGEINREQLKQRSFKEQKRAPMLIKVKFNREQGKKKRETKELPCI